MRGLFCDFRLVYLLLPGLRSVPVLRAFDLLAVGRLAAAFPAEPTVLEREDVLEVPELLTLEDVFLTVEPRELPEFFFAGLEAGFQVLFCFGRSYFPVSGLAGFPEGT